MFLFLAFVFGFVGITQNASYEEGHAHTLPGVIILWSLCGLCLALHAFEERH